MNKLITWDIGYKINDKIEIQGHSYIIKKITYMREIVELELEEL